MSETINVPSFGNSKKKKTTELTLSSVLNPLPKKAKQKLLDMYKIDPTIKVQSFIKIPKQWVSLSDLERLKGYLDKNGGVNHRSILKEEIVVDVDSESKEYGKIHLIALEYYWNQLEFRREQYDSGGDGYHVHFTFKQLREIANEDISQVKKDIISHLCGPFMFLYRNKVTGSYSFSIKNKKRVTLDKENLEQVSHICLVDKKLIQIEYAPHRKGKMKTPYISDLKFTSSPLIEGKTPRIPKFVRDSVQERKEKRKREFQQRKWTLEQLQTAGAKYPACIRFYLGEEINGEKFIEYKDGTKRAMFHLLSFFKHTKAEDELVDYITEWLKKISVNGEAIDSHGKSLDRYLIRMSLRSNKGLVGCSARHDLLEELGCDKVCEGCPYNKY